MHDNILNKISTEFSSLTKSGKVLADYILKNKTGIQYMPITVLADQSGVSEATITRFCRLLGLEGYNDLKLSLAIAGTVQNEKSFHSDDKKNRGMIEETGDRLLEGNIQALEETRALMDRKEIGKALKLLQEARQVCCFGQGGSNVTAMEAWALFSTVSRKFVHIQDSHFQAMSASLCTPEDVILFFSYSGATRELQDIQKIAKNTGVKLILVTRYKKSAAAKNADAVLLCGTNESPLQSGSVEARISQLFIIDYLFQLFRDQNEDSEEAREATAEATALKLL